MTTPNGNPAWTRSADHTFYGGDLSKKNYADLPIVNPQTDVGADHLQRIAADLAAVTLMAEFATLDIQMPGASSYASTVYECAMMTGRYVGAGYSGSSPPTGFPTVTAVRDGVIDVKFTGVYSDPYSVSATFQPVFAQASINEAGGLGVSAVAYVSGTDTVRVRVNTATGSATANVRVCLRVS